MLEDYRRYLFGIRNNLIQCGVEFPITSCEGYRDLYELSINLDSILWYYSVLEISGSEDRLIDFFIPLNIHYKSIMRNIFYKEFRDYLKEYNKLNVRSYIRNPKYKVKDLEKPKNFEEMYGIQTENLVKLSEIGIPEVSIEYVSHGRFVEECDLNVSDINNDIDFDTLEEDSEDTDIESDLLESNSEDTAKDISDLFEEMDVLLKEESDLLEEEPDLLEESFEESEQGFEDFVEEEESDFIEEGETDIVEEPDFMEEVSDILEEPDFIETDIVEESDFIEDGSDFIEEGTDIEESDFIEEDSDFIEDDSNSDIVEEDFIEEDSDFIEEDTDFIKDDSDSDIVEEDFIEEDSDFIEDTSDIDIVKEDFIEEVKESIENSTPTSIARPISGSNQQTQTRDKPDLTDQITGFVEGCATALKRAGIKVVRALEK